MNVLFDSGEVVHDVFKESCYKGDVVVQHQDFLNGEIVCPEAEYQGGLQRKDCLFVFL